ncbi:MAG: hypothetical protein EOP24_06715 [Hyphomicrobiales bacterium]|nr:MAG: hypothetical protein EOP24_06715 [Hyphomicrobiales bacterium]
MRVDAEQVLSIGQFVHQEGMLLDDRAWDAWLDFYEPGCEYWVPMWDDDGEPTRDPQRELSLIYYQSRSGLEDRVFRIRTGKSSASMPLFRTVHMRTTPVCESTDEYLIARFNWSTHAFRLGKSLTYFGRRTLWLREHEGRMRIARSHTLVCNDLIEQVLDVYHL